MDENLFILLTSQTRTLTEATHVYGAVGVKRLGSGIDSFSPSPHSHLLHSSIPPLRVLNAHSRRYQPAASMRRCIPRDAHSELLQICESEFSIPQCQVPLRYRKQQTGHLPGLRSLATPISVLGASFPTNRFNPGLNWQWEWRKEGAPHLYP